MNLLLEALKLKEIQYRAIKVQDNYLPYALIFRFIFEKLSEIQSLDFSVKLWVKLKKISLYKHAREGWRQLALRNLLKGDPQPRRVLK